MSANTRRKTPPTQQIAALNDRMRKNPNANGETHFSEGFVRLGIEAMGKGLRIIARMRKAEFQGLDAYGERNFNWFSLNGRLAYFRIRYLDKSDQRVHSDDPADTAKTVRVMQVSFWEEERGAHV